jgi:hypothetical protein
MRPMSHARRPMPCSCGKKMARDIRAEQSGRRSGELPEMESIGMSCLPEQAAEFNREFATPRAYWRPDGTFVYSHRGERLAALRKRGLFDRDEIRSPINA